MQGLTAGKVKGFDVSHHNGRVDFVKAKRAGYDFVYLKATEGSGYVDPTYLSNLKAANAAGLLVGAYHFGRPGTNDAIAEAKHFVDVLKQADTDLLPVLDLEVSTLNANDTTQWALDFVDYVEKATGRRVMLYTGVWFAQEHGGFAKKLAHLPLWVAYYNNSAPPDVGGWTAWTVWQYSETGNVPGVTGGCDVDVAVSIDAILAKTGGQSVNYKETNQIPLSVGCKGDLVKQVQQWLEIPADGLFGPGTENAVRNWQATHDADGKPGHGLQVTGVVDKETWRALNLAKTGKDPYIAKPTVAPQSAPAAKPVTPPAPAPKPEPQPAPAAPAPQPQPVPQPAAPQDTQPAPKKVEYAVFSAGKVVVFNDLESALSYIKIALTNDKFIAVERADV